MNDAWSTFVKGFNLDVWRGFEYASAFSLYDTSETDKSRPQAKKFCMNLFLIRYTLVFTETGDVTFNLVINGY